MFLISLFSSSVDVDGALSAPRVTPNFAGLGRKLGTLLLGVVNPAFLAVSLTDLGLSESHPCGAFLKEEQPVMEVPAIARDAAE